MSQPKCARKRSTISRGRASPAEVHTRNATSARGGSSGAANMPANSVGTPQNTVGRCSRSRLNTAAGVGRSAISTVVAPTDIGKVSALPSP